MAGLSMGSGQTLQITLRHLDKFSWIGLFSGGSPAGDLATAYNGAFANGADFSKRVHLFFMGAGSLEPRLMTSIPAARDLLEKQGVRNVVTFTSEGTSHEWHTWRRCLHEFAPKLFKGR
jgi:enterochelin esterase family protein